MKLELEGVREAYAILRKHPGGAASFFARFYERMASDAMIGFFFSGKDLTHIASQQQAFIERAIGLRDHYAGKSPATAHLGLPPILPGFFDRRIVILKTVLGEFGVSEAGQKAWIAFENAFRASIETKR